MEGVLQELAEVTTVEDEGTPSQFPSDLQTINNILAMTLDYLLLDLAINPENPIPLSVVSVKAIKLTSACMEKSTCTLIFYHTRLQWRCLVTYWRLIMLQDGSLLHQ